MKLFWVILKGLLVIWGMLMVAVTGMLLLVLDANRAVATGGIASTLIAGAVVYFIVRSRARSVERAHPELRKRRR